MSYSLLSDAILSPFLGDEELARSFSAEAELEAYLAFETALAKAEAQAGVISPAVAGAVADGLARFRVDWETLGAATRRDGVAVPALVAQLRDFLGGDAGRSVHHGSTSQDVIDTSLVLRLRAVTAIYRQRLLAIGNELEAVRKRFGRRPLMGRTRMQRAVPITVADRLDAWAGPVHRALARLDEITPRLLVLQFGGAAGNLHILGDRGPAVARALAKELDLGLPDHQWQAQRDRIAEFGSWISLTAGALGKIGQDVALMAQNEIGEVTLSGSGTSSAMAHKQNPVRAETLVALARFEATLLSGLHQSLIHEQERSGAAWTLEWMLLPQMCIALGASLHTLLELLNSVVVFSK